MRPKQRKDLVDKNGHRTHRMVNVVPQATLNAQSRRLATTIQSVAHVEADEDAAIVETHHIDLSDRAKHLMSITWGDEVVAANSADEVVGRLRRRTLILDLPRAQAAETLGMDEDELRQERHRALQARSLLDECGIPA